MQQKNKPKICFLLQSLGAGGLETYILRFLKLYQGQIFATIVVKEGEKNVLYDEFITIGVELVFIKVGRLNIFKFIELTRFFKKRKFDSVCDMGANFAGKSLLSAKIAGIINRIAYYGQASHHFRETPLNLLYANATNWLVYKFATSILSNSQTALNYYFGNKVDNRCIVIKNGVNKELFDISISKESLRDYFGLPQNKLIVGHTGRVAPAKNHSTILEVAKQLHATNKNIIVVLAGKGTETLPKQDGLITLGYCAEIPKLLKTFDLYYFPSITEGQPNSLIEAMISGLPFVASNIPPIKECVHKDYYKQLVPLTEINASVAMIEKIINSQDREIYCCAQWSKKEYDAVIKFKEFYEGLL